MSISEVNKQVNNVIKSNNNLNHAYNKLDALRIQRAAGLTETGGAQNKLEEDATRITLQQNHVALISSIDAILAQYGFANALDD